MNKGKEMKTEVISYPKRRVLRLYPFLSKKGRKIKDARIRIIVDKVCRKRIFKSSFDVVREIENLRDLQKALKYLESLHKKKYPPYKSAFK